MTGILIVTIIGLVTGDATWGGGEWLPPSLTPTLWLLAIVSVLFFVKEF